MLQMKPQNATYYQTVLAVHFNMLLPAFKSIAKVNLVSNVTNEYISSFIHQTPNTA